MKNVRISIHEAFLHSYNDALKEKVCGCSKPPQDTGKASIEAGLGRVWPAMVCYGMIHLVPIYRGIIQCGMVYQGVWLIHYGMLQFGTVWFVVVGQSMRWFSTGDQQWPHWGWNWPAGGAFTRANPHYSHSSSRPHPTVLQLITRHNTFRGGNMC